VALSLVRLTFEDRDNHSWVWTRRSGWVNASTPPEVLILNSQRQRSQTGWDWFSFQLDGGSGELMLFGIA
jgi:hypothetical protein